MNKKILISSGGTGGHIFPAEALARDLIGRGYHVSLATDKRGLKYKNFAGGIPTYVLPSGGLKAGIFSKITSALSIGLGVIKAYAMIKKNKSTNCYRFRRVSLFPGCLRCAEKKYSNHHP